MVIDDDDPDNETWSRVAGQFAIRQVIRELEGPQYVRDYWNMDNFYRASGQAPGVYLEYARWLAANGIARASHDGGHLREQPVHPLFGRLPDRHRDSYHGRGPHSRQPVLWGFDRKHRRPG